MPIFNSSFLSCWTYSDCNSWLWQRGESLPAFFHYISTPLENSGPRQRRYGEKALLRSFKCRYQETPHILLNMFPAVTRVDVAPLHPRLQYGAGIFVKIACLPPFDICQGTISSSPCSHFSMYRHKGQFLRQTNHGYALGVYVSHLSRTCHYTLWCPPPVQNQPLS